MTIEQYEKANKIVGKIKKLKEFKTVLCQCSTGIIIVAESLYYPNDRAFIEKESRLPLGDFPDLQDFISGYLSDKITELEKQLEEL